MNLDALFDGCMTLDNTVSVLIKTNAAKQCELKQLQASMVESAKKYMDDLVTREKKYLKDLGELSSRKETLEIEKKQYTEINGKLSELVNLAQRAEHEKDNATGRNDQLYLTSAKAIQEYEQLKLDYQRVKETIQDFSQKASESACEMKCLLEENHRLIINLEKTDSVVRVLSEELKFGEHQFDIILNHLPWKPFSADELDEYMSSNDDTVRELAEVLKIQAKEMDELNDSLKLKKDKKLIMLEALANEIEKFLVKRSEVIVMERHTEGSHQLT